MEKKKILILEDDPDTCSLLTMLFQKTGYEPIVTQDGEEALNLTQQMRPDLLIFDRLLPGADGWDIYERIRNTNDLPAICLTALPPDESLSEELKKGLSDYIRKPFYNDELLARVEMLVNRPRTTAAGPLIPRNHLINPRPTVSVIIPTLKGADGSNQHVTVPYTSPVDLSADFHTYTVEWTSDKITWSVDGNPVYSTQEHIPHEPMFILANLAVGGSFPGNPDPSTQFPRGDADQVCAGL